MFSSYGSGTKLPVAWCSLPKEDGSCQECGGSLVWGTVLPAHQEDKGWQECAGLVGQGEEGVPCEHGYLMFRHITAPLASLQLLEGREIVQVRKRSSYMKVSGFTPKHSSSFIFKMMSARLFVSREVLASQRWVSSLPPFFYCRKSEAAVPAQGGNDLSPAPYQHMLLSQGEKICLEKWTTWNKMVSFLRPSPLLEHGDFC